MMWRNLISAGAVSLGAISIAGFAAAQQPLAQSLVVLSVFDCTDGETRTIYVFQSSAEGAVTLLTSQEAPPSIGNDGFIAGSTDAAERSFVFRDGSIAKGICASVTDAARAAYPVITAALLPNVDKDTSTETIATSLTIRDLQGRVNLAANENMTLQAELNQKTLALSAQTEALQVMQERLAGTLAQLDMTEQDRRKLEANVSVLNQSLSALQLSLREADQSAKEAAAEAEAMGNLADAAITWIATQQVRSAVAVRAEMCGTIAGEERPSVCP